MIRLAYIRPGWYVEYELPALKAIALLRRQRLFLDFAHRRYGHLFTPAWHLLPWKDAA